MILIKKINWCIKVKASFRLYRNMYLCHRSWRTWDHRGPWRSPSVWRPAATTTATPTRAQTTIPPRLPFPSQTEASVSVPGAPRAARQRSGTERRAGQGADVWWPSCNEDCAGATKHQGDADLFTVWDLRTCLVAVCLICICFCSIRDLTVP